MDETSYEATSEGVAGTIGVVDLVSTNSVDGELLDLILTLESDDGRVRALGDYGNAGPLGVLLGQIGEGLGDGGNVLGNAGEVVGVSVGGGLGLVADYVVPVRGGGVEWVLEELGDEGRRKVDDERLVLGCGLLA